MKNIAFILIIMFSVHVISRGGAFISLENISDTELNKADSIHPVEQLVNLMLELSEREENPLLKQHFETIALFATDTTFGFEVTEEDQKVALEVLKFMTEKGSQWETYASGPRPLMMSFKSSSDGKYSYYWLGLPKGFNSQKTDFPLFFELHGSGGGSNNNPRKMLFQPLQPEIKGVTSQGYRKEGFWVLPWGRGDKGYSEQAENDVLEVLADFDSKFKTNPSRQYMYGFSMGGMGTLKIALLTMDRWAAIGSYSGAMRDADLEKAKNFQKMPVWMAWGEEERFAEGNRKLRDLFIEAEIVELDWREIEGIGHKYLGDYQENLMDWLIEHRKE